jgi:small GTP-binding protein
MCIFGDGGVGKSTLINRYLTGLYESNLKMTIGADFFVKRINIKGYTVTLQIWDFAGEQRFKFILPSYLTGSSGCVFMFDITRYSSINNLKDWMDVFHKGIQKQNKEIPLLMVGGKKDLDSNRAIDTDYAREIAEKNNFDDYIECSSKTGENVENIFSKIAEIMLLKAEHI